MPAGIRSDPAVTELWHCSATQLAAGYAAGAFTPREALASCLARAERCQGSLNAMVAWDRDGALRAAQASGQRWRQGVPLSRLDGVPVTVKDNLHMAGVPTSWGSRLLRGYVRTQDEWPVARLRNAGAVLFGKTNLPEFAMQGHTRNDVFGTTRNPWNRALTPGGSSGGAAAAVAAGCGPLALVTDGGGSTRRPASHCGLVGFKPSAGLVPRHGGLPEIFLDFEVVGGMGRTVQDVGHLMEVLAAAKLSAPEPVQARILYMPRFGAHPVDAGIARSIRQAAERLEALGHRVEEGLSPAEFENINAAWPQLSQAGLAWMENSAARWPELHGLCGGNLDLGVCGDVAREAFAAGRAMEAGALFEVMDRVKALKQQLGLLFTRCDFILTPATAALPWRVAQSHPSEIDGQPVGSRGHAVFTAFVNAAGLPAMALPTKRVGGLPTGMQLVGPKGADAALLALSRQYEAAHPWAQHRPQGFEESDP
ncbi:MAG: amidase [Rhodoferax sp.]|nr:amidase [Rhodoferax sp.]